MVLRSNNKDKVIKTQTPIPVERVCRDSCDAKDIKDNLNDFGNSILACRCMEISERAVKEAIRQGATTVDAVKRATMAGMGLCQSKTCFNIIARLISEETCIPLSQIRPMKIRIPVRPVKISSLDLEI